MLAYGFLSSPILLSLQQEWRRLCFVYVYFLRWYTFPPSSFKWHFRNFPNGASRLTLLDFPRCLYGNNPNFHNINVILLCCMRRGHESNSNIEITWWQYDEILHRFPSVLRHSLCFIICCIYRASALRIITLILRRFRHISTFGRKIASFSILRVYQINAPAEMWDPVAISRSAVQFCENLFVRGRKQDSLLQVKAPWCARSLHAFYHAREIRPTWRDVTLPLGWVSEVRDRILATSSAVSCATVRRQFHRSKPFRADSFCSVLFITQHWQVSSWVIL